VRASLLQNESVAMATEAIVLAYLFNTLARSIAATGTTEISEPELEVSKFFCFFCFLFFVIIITCYLLLDVFRHWKYDLADQRYGMMVR